MPLVATEDRELLAELPRLRSDLRRGCGASEVTLRRLVALAIRCDRGAMQELGQSQPSVAKPWQTAWLCPRAAAAVGLTSPRRRLLAAAGLLTNLYDDPVATAAAVDSLPRCPSTLPRLLRQTSERIDGTGLPLGLTEHRLTTASQLLALACEVTGRLYASDAIAAGQSLMALSRDAGRWRADLVETVVSLAMPLVGRAAVEMPGRLLRIDTPHGETPPPSTQPVRESRLGGLRASRGLSLRGRGRVRGAG